MERLKISIACETYDRVAALATGQVQVEGCDSTVINLHAEELFSRTIGHQEFDVSELSLSSYLLATSRGGFPYIALPVFPSRVFRHSGIYINTKRGIAVPEDLRGKTVGVPEYQMTAALWVRGLLSDQYGVHARDIHWRTGGLEQPGRTEKIALKLPEGFDVRPIAADRRLNDLLVSGELDAIVSARVPSSFGKDPSIARLFPDYRRAEQSYFRDTGLFPIMHVLVMRRSLVTRFPWLASSLYKAFCQAKDLAVAHLHEIGALAVTLPWLVAELEETEKIMGADYWPYGIEQNRTALEAALRYAREQGVVVDPLSLDDLFVPGIARHGGV
jgi:4,5-dihydroxyphthalate decarboxylase